MKLRIVVKETRYEMYRAAIGFPWSLVIDDLYGYGDTPEEAAKSLVAEYKKKAKKLTKFVFTYDTEKDELMNENTKG